MATTKFAEAQALEEKVSLYYPYMAPEFMRSHPLSVKDHILYLKTLCLICDVIVVPPSHILHFQNVASIFNPLYELLEAGSGNQSGIISSISTKDRGYKDFLKRKRSYYSGIDKDLEQEHYNGAKKVLSKFSTGIYRNVERQKRGFHQGLLSFFSSPIYDSDLASQKSNDVAKAIASQPRLKSRSALINFLNTTSDLKLDFYQTFLDCVRIEYLKQGGSGNCSILPPIGDCLTQSKMKEYLSKSELEQLQIYDPELILGVLAHLDIPRKIIYRLPAREIIELRSTNTFKHFVSSYRRLVKTANQVGKENLKDQILSHFQRQREQLEKDLKHHEDIVNFFLFGLGTCLSISGYPIFALLNLIPPFRRSLGHKTLPKVLKRYILDRIYAAQEPMATYEKLLQYTVEENE
ncbi:hypothetical protein KGY77_05970 [Candidatus Bipolaricaulota bacterium]|nr:hypothetical protein [Candidatus Bipolaricaulota bacterium]